jgi:hypothetical protein
MGAVSHVEVALDRTGYGCILIDGQRIESAYAISIEAKAGETPKVRLTLNAPRITFTGDAEVFGLPATITLGDSRCWKIDVSGKVAE